MSIATKTGDNGSTALLFGRRVSKTDPRIAANGACDELNAALGMVRAFSEDPALAETIFKIQKDLVTLMGELATDVLDRERYVSAGFLSVDAGMVDALTAQIDELEKDRISFRHWATPGATKASALLDVARTVCRRAERAVVELTEGDCPVNPEIARYLNRLSDLCWLYARYVETEDGVG